MSLKYLFLLWVSTIFIAPFIFGAYEMNFDIPGQVVSLFEIFPITIIFGIFFSLPTLGLIYLISVGISRLKFSQQVKKIVLVILTIIGIVISLQVMGGSLVPVLTFTYVSALIGAFLFMELMNKFQKKTTYT